MQRGLPYPGTLVWQSKIEAGLLALHYLDFDLEITAFDVCHLIHPRLGNKPIEILCRISDKIPAFIKSDPGRIRQVLVNLMGNAAKFTHSGEIELFLDIIEEKTDQLKLYVSVRDTGIGIAKDKLDTIFELFQQADGTTTRKYGGTGLGLSICKHLARLLGGEVWVDSTLGKGSTFHFTAWVEKSDKRFDKKPSMDLLKGKKVLMVDDNQNNLEILTHILNRAGMETVALERAEDVLPTLNEVFDKGESFDICVLDIHMPNISGYEVAKQIRITLGRFSLKGMAKRAPRKTRINHSNHFYH